MMPRPQQHAENYGYSTNRHEVILSEQSARVVVPMVCDIFRPASVLDIGCGVGYWLKAFLDNGVAKVCGCDGPWVPTDALQIPADCFHPVDFYSDIPEVGRFDLSICLEVAEHVSSDVACRIVSLLCRSADLVLFSAAVPGQGGYEHINEHFQDYWISQFGSHGFSPYDSIRPRIWMNERVCWWYQQNCLVFANAAAKQRCGLKEAPIISSLVHPFLYNRVRDPKNYSLQSIAKHFPYYLKRAVMKHLAKS